MFAELDHLGLAFQQGIVERGAESLGELVPQAVGIGQRALGGEQQLQCLEEGADVGGSASRGRGEPLLSVLLQRAMDRVARADRQREPDREHDARNELALHEALQPSIAYHRRHAPVRRGSSRIEFRAPNSLLP